jgi:putative flippase GtrA
MPDSDRRPRVLEFDGAERNRLVRFVVVGLSNTALTLLVYVIGVGLGAWYPAAAALGYAAGMVNGYTWNRRWTFQSGPFDLAEFSRYVLVQGSGLVLNVLGLVLAVDSIGMGKLTAEVVTLIPIVLITYSVNRFWTFRLGATTQS